MEETKPKIIKEVETIPPDTDITITVNSYMYHRLQKILLGYMPFKDFEQLGQVIETIKSQGEHKDPLGYHAETILILMSLIEESAKRNKIVKTVKFDLSNGKVQPD